MLKLMKLVSGVEREEEEEGGWSGQAGCGCHASARRRAERARLAAHTEQNVVGRAQLRVVLKVQRAGGLLPVEV